MELEGGNEKETICFGGCALVHWNPQHQAVTHPPHMVRTICKPMRQGKKKACIWTAKSLNTAII